jgi:heme a synthase
MVYRKVVYYWLVIGLVMVFMQVVIGGITRLTESGLSITKWEVVTGTIPPLTESDWDQAFELYKETPQYKEINEGMSLSDFKFIYFWEYIHRFWARVMGFVFLIPFLFFLYKSYIDRVLLKRLIILILLAASAAAFGWVMVASGLVERPWVNAYKLSVHLSLALLVFGYLFYTILLYRERRNTESVKNSKMSYLRQNVLILLLLFCLQVFLGGMMSGMKIAVVYPSWPDMNGEFVPSILLNMSSWNIQNFVAYDSNEFMPAFIHFLHRNTAYILFLFGSFVSLKFVLSRNDNHDFVKDISTIHRTGYFIFFVLIFQVLLGIITVINSKGTIPVSWGVFHQAGAMLLLAGILNAVFITQKRKP